MTNFSMMNLSMWVILENVIGTLKHLVFFSSKKQWIYILYGVYTCKSLHNEENILLQTLYPFQSQS